MTLDGWAIYQNELRIMTDYMEKVSYWELLRTLQGALLNFEKLGKKGKKYVLAGIRTHTYWKTQIQSPLLYQLIYRGRLKYVPNIFNLILSKIVPN